MRIVVIQNLWANLLLKMNWISAYAEEHDWSTEDIVRGEMVFGGICKVTKVIVKWSYHMNGIWLIFHAW